MSKVLEAPSYVSFRSVVPARAKEKVPEVLVPVAAPSAPTAILAVQPTAFAGSLPTPTNYDPKNLPTLPCLRRWSRDEVITKLHAPIEEMRVRRGLPPLTEDQKRKIHHEYCLMPMACTKVGLRILMDRSVAKRKELDERIAQQIAGPGIPLPAGPGRGGAGEAQFPKSDNGVLPTVMAWQQIENSNSRLAPTNVASAADWDRAKERSHRQIPIPICGSLSFWLDGYGHWHCCECDPWRGKPGGAGAKMCRGYHVLDNIPIGMEGGRPFLVEVDDYKDDDGSPLEMIVDVADLSWALKE